MGKLVLKLAQDPMAKKCGILQPEDSLEGTTLQEYLDMYKKPISDDSMQAILQLTEVVVDKKKNKRPKIRRPCPRTKTSCLLLGN
jgi:hypothetical protein